MWRDIVGITTNAQGGRAVPCDVCRQDINSLLHADRLQGVTSHDQATRDGCQDNELPPDQLYKFVRLALALAFTTDGQAYLNQFQEVLTLPIC